MTEPAAKDPYYQLLKSFIIESTGMVFYDDKDEELIRIIHKQMESFGVEGYAVYLGLLKDSKKGQSEIDELVGELTIGETYFFRHQEQIDAVRDIILPQLIQKNQHTRRLRIWSAGCAIGAEPYTLAIMLESDFGGQLAGWTVDIIGSDINKKFLALAKRGRFSEWALRATPKNIRKSYFKQANIYWDINSTVKKKVSFQYHNLVESPFPSYLDNLFAFDLILCRNVTIYFKRNVIKKMIGQFHDCLVDDGWLMVGHSEPDMETFKVFRSVNAPGTVLYQKSEKADEIESLAPPVWIPLPPESQPLAEIKAAPVPALPPLPTSEPITPKKSGLDRIKEFADQGKLEEAAAYCQKLQETDKLNPSIHLFHALVLEQMGETEAAEKALRAAIYLDRSFVLPHYHFGVFLQKKGDRKGAARSFDNAIKLLSKMNNNDTFEDGDGISVMQLKELAKVHIEVIKG